MGGMSASQLGMSESRQLTWVFLQSRNAFLETPGLFSIHFRLKLILLTVWKNTEENASLSFCFMQWVKIFFYSSCIAIKMTYQWEQLFWGILFFHVCAEQFYLLCICPCLLVIKCYMDKNTQPEFTMKKQNNAIMAKKLIPKFSSCYRAQQLCRVEGLVHNTIHDVLLWWFLELREHHLSTYWQICFSHLSGRRISSCSKRSKCTIAAEDHPWTAGCGKEGFRTWRTSCGSKSLNPLPVDGHARGKVQFPIASVPLKQSYSCAEILSFCLNWLWNPVTM